CTSTCAPASPSLRATSRPTPSVEPVTSAVFPLSFSIAGLLTGLDERDHFGIPGVRSRHSRRLKRSQPVQPGAKKRRGELGLRLSFEGGTSSSNPSSSSKESGANSRRIGAYKVPQSEVGVILWSLSASAHERR